MAKTLRTIHLLVSIPVIVDDDDDFANEEEQARELFGEAIPDQLVMDVLEEAATLDLDVDDVQAAFRVSVCEMMEPGHPDGYNIRIK